MKKLLSIFVLMLLFVPIIPVHASGTDIQDMDITVLLDKKGNATVREIWDMNVDEGTEVYKVLSNMSTKPVSDLKVVDEKGHEYKDVGDWDPDLDFDEKSYKSGIYAHDSTYELCFGISEYGHRTYTFTYQIENFVEQYNECQGINFALFSDLSLDIAHAKIKVNYPAYDFNKDNSRIWAYGYYGTVLFENGDIVMETNQPLESGNNKMQLLMKINDGTFDAEYVNGLEFMQVLEDANQGSSYEYTIDEQYRDEEWYNDYYDDGYRYDDSGDTILAAIFGFTGIAVVGGIITSLSYAAKKKTKKYFEDGSEFGIPDKKDVDLHYHIPCNGDIFRFYYFAKEAELVSDEDKGGLLAAILLQWMSRKEADYKETGESGWLFKHKDYEIRMYPRGFDNEYEEKAYHFFMKAAGSNRILERKEFENWCTSNYTKIENYFEDIEEGYLQQLIDEGLILEDTVYNKSIFGTVEQKVYTYTEAFEKEMIEVIGFYNFLEDLTYIDGEQDQDIETWDQYLVFASVVNLADEVYKQLGTLYPKYKEDPYYYDHYYYYSMMHHTCYHGYHTAHVAANSSSSSNGFGGGSSFGGGGGGFSGGGGGGVR